MDIITKSVAAKITDTSTGAEQFPGTFLVELSNETLDRDGDVLKASEWEMPLPQQITFVNDHSHKMKSVVGSAVPELVDGKIICQGTWAETADAQDTRKVVKHVPYTSVAFREKRNQKSGTVSRELINGSFVVVPSNPNAKVLSSKSVAELSDDTLLSDLTIKQFRELTLPPSAISVSGTIPPLPAKAIGSALPEGMEIVVDENSSTVQVKQHGNLLGEHKFSTTPEGARSDSPDPQSADREKAALAAANQIVSRTTEQD